MIERVTQMVRLGIAHVRYNAAMVRFLWRDMPTVADPLHGKDEQGKINLHLMTERAMRRCPRPEDFGLTHQQATGREAP